MTSVYSPRSSNKIPSKASRNMNRDGVANSTMNHTPVSARDGTMNCSPVISRDGSPDPCSILSPRGASSSASSKAGLSPPVVPVMLDNSQEHQDVFFQRLRNCIQEALEKEHCSFHQCVVEAVDLKARVLHESLARIEEAQSKQLVQGQPLQDSRHKNGQQLGGMKAQPLPFKLNQIQCDDEDDVQLMRDTECDMEEPSQAFRHINFDEHLPEPKVERGPVPGQSGADPQSQWGQSAKNVLSLHIQPAPSHQAMTTSMTTSQGDQHHLRKATTQMSREHSDYVEASLTSYTHRRSMKNWKVEKVHEWYSWWQSIEEPPREGALFRFTNSNAFSHLCMLVILLNGVLIIWSTNLAFQEGLEDGPGNKTDLEIMRDRFLEIVEYAFMLYYIVELSVKLSVHKIYFFCGADGSWNCVDAILVAFSLIDVLATTMAAGSANVNANVTFLRVCRFLKLSKVLRIFRALKFISELRLMLDCLFGCLLSLFWSVFLMSFLICIFAIFFVQGFANFLEAEGTEELKEEDLKRLIDSFGSVQSAMNSLFQASSGGKEWSYFYNMVRPLGGMYRAIFILFILFMMISVMNIVTSIFIERAMRFAVPEQETQLLEQDKSHYKDSQDLLQLCESLGIDQDHDGYITEADLHRVMAEERIRRYFDVRGIAFEDTHMFYRMLDRASKTSGHPGVDLATFVKGCMRLKGTASNSELHTMAFEIKLIHQAQQKMWDEFEQHFSTVHNRLADKPDGGAEVVRNDHHRDSFIKALLEDFEQKVAGHARSIGGHARSIGGLVNMIGPPDRSDSPPLKVSFPSPGAASPSSDIAEHTRDI